MRRRRFRHAVKAMVKAIVEDVNALGISKIVLGNPEGIRENNHKGRKANAMIHNFWSFNYTVQRFKEVAEEHGIKVKPVSEYKTSTTCPKCSSENTTCAKRLFICLNCGLVAHRDAVGVLNIGSRLGESVNGVMAHPLLLRWNGMRWEPKRAMNKGPVKTLEAETESAEMMVESHTL